MDKKQEYTVGYRYHAGVHMALCHGPIDGINRIIVGDKKVWDGLIKDGSLTLDMPNLFGGENAEGGISGSLDVMSGSPTQGRNGYLASVLGEAVPAFRGIVSVVLKRFMICSMNPYPKAWKFRARRIPDPFGSAAYAVGNYAANPAMIVAECLTNPSWGMGLAVEELDRASFTGAAATLQAERFGLCARWDQRATLEDFIAEICQIIDGQLTMDPSTGKYALKLIRDDYDHDALLTLGPSEIISLEDFSRPDPRELVNEVTVVFEDWETGVEQSITESNTAALALNPEVNAVELRWQAVPTQELARRLAIRELSQYSAGLATCSIEANRKAAGLKMGDCFVLNWPKLGIDRMIMRVASMAQGSSTGWMVKIGCVQDLEGIPDTTYTEVTSGWAAPSHDPVPMAGKVFYELPYFLVGSFVTGDNDSAWADLPEGFGFLAVAAAQPSGTTTGFKVNATDAYGVWNPVRLLAFTEYGTLAADLDDSATTFTVAIGVLSAPEINAPILVDGEWMVLRGWNGTTGAATVERGCMDSVPAAHASGAVVWFCGFYDNSLRTAHVTGQTLQVKLQPTAGNGDLPLGSCPTESFRFDDRCARPIAPANIRVNGYYRPKTLAADFSILYWSRRNRMDTAKIRPNTDGDYLPEAGTTVAVAISERLFPESPWVAASTTAGLDGVIQLSLAGLFTPNAYALRFSLTSALGAKTSLQANVVETARSPWIPRVQAVGATTPPGSPAAGDAWVAGAGATGAWAGKAGNLAVWRGGWNFRVPSAGDKVLNAADSKTWGWDGNDWEVTT